MSESEIVISPLTPADRDGWLPLWQANNDGQCPGAVTAETWKRLVKKTEPVHGLCARQGTEIVGILHYILHPTTGQIAPVCYMQDLFVTPAHRRRGIARAMVEELARIGARAQWARIYWLAEDKNDAAQKLYKTLGITLDFSLHVWPL